MRHRAGFLVIAVPFAFAATGAWADVTISSAATSNMSCSSGICAPTAVKAILNVNDLESLLASGNVEVATAGSGVQAKTIQIKAALSWPSGSVLTLDSYNSIVIHQPISVTGLAGVTIVTNDGGQGGALRFANNGNVTFALLGSQLNINGTSYRLENDLKTLAYDIALRPGGAYALANADDESNGGIYSTSPIGTNFRGQFTGLGNPISHLVIVDDADAEIGLFASLATKGVLANIRLKDVTIRASNNAAASAVGGLAGVSFGAISDASVAGGVSGGTSSADVGGLVGENSGTIMGSRSTKEATGSAVGGLVGTNLGSILDSWSGDVVQGGLLEGGLVGGNGGTIATSFATGAVKVVHGVPGGCGGLVGYNIGAIVNSYAQGSAGGHNSNVGGLAGANNIGTITSSYSTGLVTGNSIVGGFIGDNSAEVFTSYWDTTSSGTNQGVGNGSSSGVTGLTTTELQSGLPTGFGNKIWAEKPNINNGLPYLIANPPPKK